MLGIEVKEHGGPEVLGYGELPDPAAGEDGLVVRVAAAGVNFLDVYHRTGLYPTEPPFTPGVEGAGVVVAAGRHVTGFREGDRVAWSNNPASYAELVRVDPAAAVPVPDGVELEMAAASLLQGMTAHYLVHDTFRLSAGDRCLVHAGAGGVGLLAIQMAKHLGAEVFTTVGGDEKAELARGAGADHVIDYTRQDFAEAIERIAGPRPLAVVYDGVGRDTFDAGLRLLRRRGTMVTFGNASGPVEPLSPLRLMREGSIFLTRPTLGDHVATRQELEARAGAVYDMVGRGALSVRIGERLPLEQAADAHRALEARRTTGKILLVPAGTPRDDRPRTRTPRAGRA